MVPNTSNLVTDNTISTSPILSYFIITFVIFAIALLQFRTFMFIKSSGMQLRFGILCLSKISLIYAVSPIFQLWYLMRLSMATTFMVWTLWVSHKEASTIFNLCFRKKENVSYVLLSFRKEPFFSFRGCRSMPNFRSHFPILNKTSLPSEV